jgi:hypothetical protein
MAVTLAAVLALPVAAAEPVGARAFLAGLYSHYPHRHGQPVFDAAGTSARLVFDPPLVQLIRDSERLTPEGDVPPLDGDPICDCQDSAGLKARIGAIRATGPSTATAPVDLTFAGGEGNRLDFDLVRSRGQWRVHDVHSKDMPSLRAYLIQANRDALADKKKH